MILYLRELSNVMKQFKTKSIGSNDISLRLQKHSELQF